MATFTSLPGFRDFYPEEMAQRTRVTAAWRAAAQRFGFEEYDAPPLEPLELYIEKSGAEIVTQLYSFTDKGDRDVSLRPEMTPSLARMVGARANGLRKPVRWFSVPQLFRYERTQRGRLREHFQWNVDILGEESEAADAEVLAVALTALRLLGLGEHDIVARVNDRRLLQQILLHVGVGEAQLAAAYAVIDKIGREPEQTTRDRLANEAGLNAEAVVEVLDIFSHRDFDALSAAYADVEGISVELDRLRRYFAQLDAMGLGGFVRFDPAIVRGLAYYTGIVFEIFDRKGELRAVCGGGRYDNLLEAIGGQSMPGVGFGMGDVVLTELLRDRGLMPDYKPSIEYYIVAVSEGEWPLARRIAAALRSAGRGVIYSLKPAGVGKQFKDADARGARSVIVIGGNEAAAGVAVVREMGAGGERRVPLEELLTGSPGGASATGGEEGIE